jgi:response regulator of citrate/malate metabolism
MSDDLRVALTAAGGAGLSRTEMNHTIFGRNRSRAEIQRAVQLLQQAGLAHGAYDYSAVGRPVERWYATTE